jgi:hypothetical protein
VVNPVELIGKSRRRLARLAAIKAALYVLLPVAVTLVLALNLDDLGAMTWERWGYLLDTTHADALRQALLFFAVAEALALALLSWRAYRNANDFVGTAKRIDDLIGGRQEIVTLATLTDPAHPEPREKRSPLFPMLWRRAISYLDLFEPRREFKAEIREPLTRSSLYALVLVALLGLTAAALIHTPTLEQALAHRLRVIARALDSSHSDASHALAKEVRDTAAKLENPQLPPEQKVQQLEQLKHEIEKLQPQMAKATQNGSGRGDSGGQNGSGQGNGKGTGNGTGSGSGSGKGSGKGGQGSNQSGKNKNKSGEQQLVELGNDISKAQAQIQTESGPRDQAKGSSEGNKEQGNTLAEGKNPNRPGNANQPNGAGNIELPKPGNLAKNEQQGNNSNGRHDDKGSTGDTHLGEFPKAVNYERFYKPGESGPPIEVRDARYVTFRLPTDTLAAGGQGRTVPDTGRPAATTAYTNAPLREQRLAISPDERQLVPPRYRDLIH